MLWQFITIIKSSESLENWEKRILILLFCMVIIIMHFDGFFVVLPILVRQFKTLKLFCIILNTQKLHMRSQCSYLWAGFDEDSLQKSCCGIGGDYNFDLKNICGPEVPVCPNPNDHISWDGVHLTQNAYKFMAHWLIDDIVPKLRCIV